MKSRPPTEVDWGVGQANQDQPGNSIDSLDVVDDEALRTLPVLKATSAPIPM